MSSRSARREQNGNIILGGSVNANLESGIVEAESSGVWVWGASYESISVGSERRLIAKTTANAMVEWK